MKLEAERLTIKTMVLNRWHWGLTLLGTLILSTGCSWSTQWFKSRDQIDNSQLKNVGAQELELAKFSVEEVPTTPTVTPAAPIPLPLPASAAKSGAIKKKIPIKTAPTPLLVAVPVAPTYPSDYPAQLKSLDQQAALTWSLFKPAFEVDEKMFLDVDYLGLTVGKVVLSYRGIKSMRGRPVYHFQAFFKSAPFYSAIYELDDHVDTYVDQENFVGLRYNLVQRESKQDVDEVQLYDRETLTTSAYQKQVRGGKIKNRKWQGPIPRFSIDPLSVLWLIRGLPLKTADKYVIPVVNKGKVLSLEASVEGRERIKTKLGEFASIRVKAHTIYTGRTLKSGDMTFWLSDDVKRTLLRAQAKIQLGSVYAEAVKGE